jgi:HEPN domain-containing protein
VNRTDLQQLAELRLEDARVLFQNQRYSAAYYLCGYAVECGLKARIASLINQHEFPPYATYSRDVYTHDLKALVRLAELGSDLIVDRQANSQLEANWTEVEKWSEQSRYDVKSMQDAQQLLAAVASIPDGVLEWIRQHW